MPFPTLRALAAKKRKKTKAARRAPASEATARHAAPQPDLRRPPSRPKAAPLAPAAAQAPLPARPDVPPTARGITLTDAQWAAVKAVCAWFRSTQRAPFFYLAGFAGTGKSTLLPFILDELGLTRVCHAAYTGKAASVMRRKGAIGASTIHRLLYNSSEFWSDGKLKFRFTLNKASPLLGAQLLVLDECSMVYPEMAQDLMSFGVPILVMGDPGQLPPIEGAGFFTRGTPDAFLQEVHRQALGNPILAASMAVRENPYADLSQFADGRHLSVLRMKETSADLFKKADQILVGRHKTRRAINTRLKRHLGHEGTLPLLSGAKLVCLRNKHELGLMNGVVYKTIETGRRPDAALLQGDWAEGAKGLFAGRYKDLVKLERNDPRLFERWFETRIEDEDGTQLDVSVHVAAFEEDESGAAAPEARQHLDFKMMGPLNLVQATWGYALTVHKAQGSQWDEVVMTMDPVGGGAENVGRWIYTGLTRAAERLTVVL